MAIVTKSIGTDARDYSTMTLWAADLTNAGVYSSGDDALGECYNDSEFDEVVDIGQGISENALSSITLTSADGEEHSGIPGTGVILGGSGYLNVSNTSDVNISKLEVKSSSNLAVYHSDSPYLNKELNISRLIFETAYYGVLPNKNQSGLVIKVMNCMGINTRSPFEYNIGSSYSVGAELYNYNNTSFNCIQGCRYQASTTYSGHDFTNQTHRNLLCIDCDTDFKANTPLSALYDIFTNCMSSDTTAVDESIQVDCLGSKTDPMFISTVSGSEDLHISSGSDPTRLGYEIGVVPTGVNLDIDGEDRSDSPWDIGADQSIPLLIPIDTVDGSGIIGNKHTVINLPNPGGVEGVGWKKVDTIGNDVEITEFTTLGTRFTNPRYYAGKES